MSGNLDDAVSALQEGIRHFPNDNHLKIELSRLFTQKNDIAQSISILEELLSLQPLSSKDFSKSVNETTSNQINISEESFNLVLILADLYFHNNQTEKAWELLDQIKKDPALKRDDQLEAEQYEVFRLINFGKTDEAEKILDSLFEKDKNNIFSRF